MLPVPDLLHLEPRLGVDFDQLYELLGLAFTGRADAEGIDRALVGLEPGEAPWQAEHFAADLFVGELVTRQWAVRAGGNVYTPNTVFLERVLTSPPTNLEAVRFRQQILDELWRDAALYDAALSLYTGLYEVINMFKIPGRMARLDLNTFRLDLFRRVKDLVDSMALHFGEARSGLARLHEVGSRVRESEEYRILTALLDHSEGRASLNVDLSVGATGQISRLQINRVRLDEGNPFTQSAPRRWLGKLRAAVWHGFRLDDETIFNRLVQEVYDRLATPIMGLAQLLGHLEIYLVQHQLRQRVEARGLRLCLAELEEGGPLVLEDLFNPLLLDDSSPVPCTLTQDDARRVTLVTGPNSGGKTRLLQAVGLAQLLGQGGFYVAAGRARLAPVYGLFVSLIEHEAVDHAEGRLGRELERIRTMFDAMRVPSMVLIDELCSGTNPSEGIEVFSLVLRLLERVRPVAFISTHFLDYARGLEASPPIAALDFIHVEMDGDQRSTYQFVPGVAETSLAALMAERMGVTFEVIAESLDTRVAGG